MKKFSILYITALLLTITFGCDNGFLDQVPDDRLTLEQTFSRRSTVESFLGNIYAHMPDEFNQRFVASGQGYGNSGPWTGGSDEAEYVWGFVTSNSMNIGAWDPTSGFVSTLWSNFYRGIRSATDFMKNVDQCADCGSLLITQYKAEAKALRAIYYFYLMRMFGPVVIIGDDPISQGARFSEVQLPRNSFDECVEYVIAELDAASPDLLMAPKTNDTYGRITQGFVHAIKIQTLLFAASPLFNGNTDYASMVNKDGKQLINQQYDANKWKRAAEAAKSFIDTYVPTTYDLYKKNNASGLFDPYLSCRDVMLEDWNREVIFARVAASVGTRQYELTPYHSGSAAEVRGSGGLGATQNMVDAYFMANGKSIDDPTSGYQTTGFSNFKAPYDDQARQTFNQWVNREPRFYVGITYDGSVWLNKNTGTIVTRTSYSGNSGRAVGGNDYSPTGYIVRKNMSLGNWTAGNRTLVLMRLAQIYLDYAEALNEYDPGNPDIIKYLNLIRQRAGVPEYGSETIPLPGSQGAAREAIRKERERVELAFENVRYFDVRRWKIAEQTENGPIYGLDINAQDVSNFYKHIPFETRVFTTKHYLFPIPQDEVSTDKELVQNTGW